MWSVSSRAMTWKPWISIWMLSDSEEKWMNSRGNMHHLKAVFFLQERKISIWVVLHCDRLATWFVK